MPQEEKGVRGKDGTSCPRPAHRGSGARSALRLPYYTAKRGGFAIGTEQPQLADRYSHDGSDKDFPFSVKMDLIR